MTRVSGSAHKAPHPGHRSGSGFRAYLKEVIPAPPQPERESSPPLGVSTQHRLDTAWLSIASPSVPFRETAFLRMEHARPKTSPKSPTFPLQEIVVPCLLPSQFRVCESNARCCDAQENLKPVRHIRTCGVHLSPLASASFHPRRGLSCYPRRCLFLSRLGLRRNDADQTLAGKNLGQMPVKVVKRFNSVP